MPPPADPAPPDLPTLLERHRDALVRYLERHGKGLARYESAEDLAQGVHLHALTVADRYEYRGERAFRGWVFALARQHVADRNAWWKAARRNAGTMLRISYGRGSTVSGWGAVQPAGLRTGPGTFASRRELVVAATRALAALPPRDAQLVRMVTDGLTLQEVADRLDLSHAAAQRARLRALERFRKVFELATRATRDPS